MLCSAVIQQSCFAQNVAADEALERATAEWRLDRKNVLNGKFARKVNIDVELAAHYRLQRCGRVNTHNADGAKREMSDCLRV